MTYATKQSNDDQMCTIALVTVLIYMLGSESRQDPLSRPGEQLKQVTFTKE